MRSQFQKILVRQSHGLIFPSSELLKFSATVECAIDFLIVAVSSFENLKVDNLMIDNFQQCEIAVRSVDSTFWILFSPDREVLDCLEDAALGF